MMELDRPDGGRPFDDPDASLGESLEFPEGLPGFEACRHFALVPSGPIAPLQFLHAIDGPPAAFLTIDPALVLRGYRREIRDRDRARLGCEDEAKLLWRAVVALDADGSAWVNLRAPIVVNPARLIGFQLMPKDAIYPLRQPLMAAK